MVRPPSTRSAMIKAWLPPTCSLTSIARMSARCARHVALDEPATPPARTRRGARGRDRRSSRGYLPLTPTVVIERVKTPTGEMVLSRRGQDFSIRVGSVELMNTRYHASEDALGRSACERLAAVRAPRVLIGGLGLGYTLRAALDALPASALIDVIEIVPEVVRWNRSVVGHLARRPLDDHRVVVRVADVVDVIGASCAAYDAIILDVDNGPDGLSHRNRALYRRSGLAHARRALVPNGILAVWSSFESPTFTTSLREVGFATDVQSVYANGRAGSRHWIWLARRNATGKKLGEGQP